jgi:ATP-dependent RNA helicase RhlE
MLDLGFVQALKRIAKLLPRRRQALLFSATMPRAIAALAEDYLDDPVRIKVATTAERVEQSVIFVPSERKRDLLTTLLDDPSFERVLVFTRTKHGADRVTRHLVGAGIDAAAIHGNKSQPQRERALAGFRSGKGRVLVATDIAARGIDVEGVSHVINFELPNVPEDYVHRIGRTARAGATGTAVAFCSDDERPHLRSIEKLTRLSVPVIPMPPIGRNAGDSMDERAATTASASRSAAVPVRKKAKPSAGTMARTVKGSDPQFEEASSLPAFLRHPTSSRIAAARRRAPQRKRTTSNAAEIRN